MSTDSNSIDGSKVPPLESSLQMSQLMYSFTDLRKWVSLYELTFQEEGISESDIERKNIVEFVNPSLIDTRMSPTNEYKNTKLRAPVSCAGILRFLEENGKWFEQGDGEDIKFRKKGDNTEPIYMEEKLKNLATFDADIVEYDDEGNPNSKLKLSGTELVYAIIVNRTQKRVAVVFRGSVVFKDWLIDLDFSKTTPHQVKSFTDKEVLMHDGFTDYLLEKVGRDDEKCKFDEILDALREIYDKEEYKDYGLLVTGHSLGGALTQLLSFMLAGSPDAKFIPKPILGISFASPVVGDKVFEEVSEELEKVRNLRHIRVSNENDVVPGTPPSIPFVSGTFTQTGVNIHVKPGEKAEVGYRTSKTILNQLTWWNPFKSISCHSLEQENSYKRHLYCKDENGELLNNELLSKTVRQLYEENASVKW